MQRPRRYGFFMFLGLLALAVVVLQGWVAYQSTRKAELISQQLAAIQSGDLSNERTRQEIFSLRVQNELKSFFLNSVLTGVGSAVTGFAALFAGLVALHRYLEERRQERQNRIDAQEKELRDRKDAREKEDRDRIEVRAEANRNRLSAELAKFMELMASKEPRSQVVGLLGMQRFLSDQASDYHLPALSAFAATARLEAETSPLLFDIRSAAEQAFRHVDDNVLRQISWQSAKLKDVNFFESALPHVDLRNADLERADLSHCDLADARLDAANLKGANLQHANLSRANLAYADLAGANLLEARLRGAILTGCKVLKMDLHSADLAGAIFDPALIPWEQIVNWRHAKFDPGLRERLMEQYGPEPTGPKILMLMWEIPPLVAGGTWTACYHLVRNLRRRGARLAVVVPWDRDSVESDPFGTEVEWIPLGIVPPRHSVSPYGRGSGSAPPWSPYAGGWIGPYGATAYTSPYGGWSSPYGGFTSSYERFADVGAAAWTVSPLQRLTAEFRDRVRRLVEERDFELIHAHDWVTFAAASAASRVRATPWIAHFHSTEADRRATGLSGMHADPRIEHIERQAVATAAGIVAPSDITARQLRESYNAPDAKLSVVPNALPRAHGEWDHVGNFETQRVLFLGRLSPQKGPDLFAALAQRVRRERPRVTFVMFGEGEARQQLAHDVDVSIEGPLDWREREVAFDQATAIVVPSRSEPFGMVILEAMLHRVPVLYPEQAGVAEIIKSGIRIQPDDIEDTAQKLVRLLADRPYWQSIVEAQSAELAAYPESDIENRLLGLWRNLAAARPTG